MELMAGYGSTLIIRCSCWAVMQITQSTTTSRWKMLLLATQRWDTPVDANIDVDDNVNWNNGNLQYSVRTDSGQ